MHIAPGGGKDRAQAAADDGSDYARDRARAAQDRFHRGYENTPTGGDIRREGKLLVSVAKRTFCLLSRNCIWFLLSLVILLAHLTHDAVCCLLLAVLACLLDCSELLSALFCTLKCHMCLLCYVSGSLQIGNPKMSGTFLVGMF